MKINKWDDVKLRSFLVCTAEEITNKVKKIFANYTTGREILTQDVQKAEETQQ